MTPAHQRDTRKITFHGRECAYAICHLGGFRAYVRLPDGEPPKLPMGCGEWNYEADGWSGFDTNHPYGVGTGWRGERINVIEESDLLRILERMCWRLAVNTVGLWSLDIAENDHRILRSDLPEGGFRGILRHGKKGVEVSSHIPRYKQAKFPTVEEAIAWLAERGVEAPDPALLTRWQSPRENISPDSYRRA